VNTIAARLEHLRERIRAAAEAAGRAPESVRLVAVSKGQPSSAVREAYTAGQRDFGENYVQELIKKAEELSSLSELRLHMLGHLQRNKVKLVVAHASFLHSLDSEALALELDKRWWGRGPTERHDHDAPLPVLIEVGIAGEAQKSGVAPGELPALVQSVKRCAGLELRGLMCMPPLSDDPEQGRPHFRRLRQLQVELGGPEVLPELSMGMSADFEVAIAEGATLVRVGTAIFGARPAKGV
jgi:pyridoxal phosphate enzyme (YggS family)